MLTYLILTLFSVFVIFMFYWFIDFIFNLLCCLYAKYLFIFLLIFYKQKAILLPALLSMNQSIIYKGRNHG